MVKSTADVRGVAKNIGFGSCTSDLSTMDSKRLSYQGCELSYGQAKSRHRWQCACEQG